MTLTEILNSMPAIVSQYKSEKQCSERGGKLGKNSYPRKVKNNRGEIFNTVVQAAKHYNIYPQSINNNLRVDNIKFAGRYPDTGEKIMWEYAD